MASDRAVASFFRKQGQGDVVASLKNLHGEQKLKRDISNVNTEYERYKVKYTKERLKIEGEYDSNRDDMLKHCRYIGIQCQDNQKTPLDERQFVLFDEDRKRVLKNREKLRSQGTDRKIRYFLRALSESEKLKNQPKWMFRN